MYRILYPIDVGCELNEKVEQKTFKPPRNEPITVEIKVYKFGIAIVDFVLEDATASDMENISDIKLPNRMLLKNYKKHVEKYLLEKIQEFRTDKFVQRYDGEFFYPIHIVSERIEVSEENASLPLEYLDVLKLTLAQYWNLVSYDVFLNKEVDSAVGLLNQSKFSINFIKVVKDYYTLFKEGKEFHRDKLSIVNSLYSFAKENPYNSSPEYLDLYKDSCKVMGLDALEKSVSMKIDQISGTYSFLGESLSTLFFIFFEIVFFMWMFWGIIDTILLWRIGVK